MIIFVSSYDSPTISNHNVLEAIVYGKGIVLLANQATRDNLIQSLLANPNLPVFVVTHGSDESFFYDAREIAFDLADAHLLTHRNVYVYACLTSNELGKACSDQNCIYFGYTGVVKALHDDPRSINHFRTIMNFIIQNFPQVNSQASAKQFAIELKETCEQQEGAIIELSNENSNYDLLGSLSCLNDIWNRLRIYIATSSVVVIHPQAVVGDIFRW
jgi:hypothetical protein